VKITVFWVVAPCSQKLSDVSEVLTVSVMKAIFLMMEAISYPLNVYKRLSE
jgi:hypothetical protein